MNTSKIQPTTETTTTSSSTPTFRVYKDQPNDSYKVPLVEDGIIKEDIGDIKIFVQKLFNIPDLSSFNLVLHDDPNPLVSSTPLSNFTGIILLKIQPITTTNSTFTYTNCLSTDPSHTDLVSLFKDFLAQSAESSRRKEELLKGRAESLRIHQELLKGQEDLLKDIQKSLSPQRDQVSISKVKTAQWDTVQNSLGIDFITRKEVSFPKDLTHIPNFDWEGKSEQTMTIPAVKHLTKYFSFPDHKYINTSGKKDLLYLNHPSVPIIFKGNADVVLVPANTPNEEIFHNILFTIGFKTSSDRVESSRLQANSQLLCSNIKSSYPVINIITDLGSTWRFKWFQENTDPETKNENPKLIVTCAIDSPSKAYELMKMRMRNLTPHFSLTKILKSKSDLNFINPIKFRLKSKANDVGNIEDLLDILDEDEAKDMLTHHFLHHLSLLEGQTRPPDQMYI
ncbi:hypothetical protein DLAC_01712 [Tieghemostelium lacteum]|uniref:Uncharacterized protein n=1 Tax=Tieghemostelium lacteum TaxID=361077 RepID=A0A152A642_TIELA|nr:hypothetical protein DLAC_01712 [Tieghemostelium lacteum]|eukprot:KYR01704.1 hypothetical protein DLAC_01712 [Tieghemostelium lacteum]